MDTTRIANDPRFAHILTDPRFKTIPRRVRKVRIGSRFQSMFTDRRFKVKYGVDKRGRRVHESSAEDLRRYYHLHDNDGKHVTSPRTRLEKLKKKRLKVVTKSDASDVSGAENEKSAVGGHTHHPDESESDGESVSSEDDEVESDSSTDVEEVIALKEPEIVHSWWDEAVSPSHSIKTGSRLALCRMDWDRINATDIYVFLASFKPQGGSIARVSVFLSDFGQQRMKNEDIQGPAELLDQSDFQAAEGVSHEGRGYSNERLRQYQLQRLNYYYAVVECDSRDTAEHIYEECDGLQYEHCGGKLDLRFIPDDMTFDEREPTSVATETTIPVGYAPPEFVTSALQQSKVQLTWDETDPQRLQTTMRKFSHDDVMKMEFDAYLASSSDSESGQPEEGGGEPNGDHSGTKRSQQLAQYRSLLGDGEPSEGVRGKDVMEVTWEPGLQEEVKEKVNDQVNSTTTWEDYLMEKKKRKRERKREKAMAEDGRAADDEKELGFDDPFFTDEVSTETGGLRKKRSKNKCENDKDKQKKSELELLMMEGEGEEEGRAHFSLDSILQTQSKSRSKRRKRKDAPPQETENDTFEVDVGDARFSALYSSHEFAPDPSHPHYRATKGMSVIMEERRRRRKRGGASVAEATPTKHDHNTDIKDLSVAKLAKTVRSKSKSLTDQRQRLKTKRKQLIS